MEPMKKGKVRDIYDLGNQLLIVTSDRISAFDSVLRDEIPRKGVILNQMSAFWFNYLHDVIPNHMLTICNTDMPAEFQTEEFEGRCMLVKKLKMLPIEAIVRGYITGSGWESYQVTGKVCGITLPNRLQESEQLPKAIFTPTTKAEFGHDQHITMADTIALRGEKTAKQVQEVSIRIYTQCAEYAKQHGIIIADTKLEFGIDDNGNLVLADEVLTPDSSRFWSAKNYKVGQSQNSFDKQFLRNWLKETNWNKEPPAPKLPKGIISLTSQKYIEAYEKLTGNNLLL